MEINQKPVDTFFLIGFLLMTTVFYTAINQYQEELIEYEVNLKKIYSAKKGELIIEYSSSSKSGSTSVQGYILGISDTTQYWVKVGNDDGYYIKDMESSENGVIIPIWYTPDKLLILPRVEETQKGMMPFIERRHKNVKRININIIIIVSILWSLFLWATIYTYKNNIMANTR